MVPKQSVNILRNRMPAIPFLPSQMPKNHGNATTGFIKSVILWNAFFRKSNGSAELPHAMILWILLSLLSFILLPL